MLHPPVLLLLPWMVLALAPLLLVVVLVLLLPQTLLFFLLLLFLLLSQLLPTPLRSYHCPRCSWAVATPAWTSHPPWRLPLSPPPARFQAA